MNNASAYQQYSQQYSHFPRASQNHNSATGVGAADFLRAHEQMAALLPTVTRLVALQKDCAKILPGLFDVCAVLQFNADQLTLGIPNAALATRLKHQLPALQAGLVKLGWQVSAIRLKVQVNKSLSKPSPSKQLQLPEQAVSALAELDASLESSHRNAALKAALTAMLQRHR